MAAFSVFSAAWVLWTLTLLLSGNWRYGTVFGSPAGPAPAPAPPPAPPSLPPVPVPPPSTTDKEEAPLPCTFDVFAGVLPDYATVVRVDSVPAGGSYGEGTADLGFPTNATRLPAVCAVTVAVHNGTSNHRFALFLPAAAAQWNQRMLTIGSYSFAGGINWPDMGQGPHYGFAALGSDSGHNSSQEDLFWDPTTPDNLLDWGYRALHGAIVLGKVLTQQFYAGAGLPLRYSYYSGCSTGGRQGLKEIQISPDSFDGALIGAPAYFTSHFMPWLTRLGASNLPESSPGHVDVAEFAVLAAAALAQCDGLDGHLDGIISRPELCVLDYGPITCRNDSGSPTADCLTPAQIATARSLYADAYTARGDFIHMGYSVGSEALFYVYLAFGDAEDLDTRYERYWLYNDTAWNWTQYSDQTFYDSVRINPGEATADAYGDIGAYEARGGKVLLYQGLADGVIPPRSTTYYYNQTRDALGGDNGSDSYDGLQHFFRYFQVPGMQHCYATPAAVQAPWMFAGAGQATLLLQNNGFGDGWGVPYQPPSAAHDALLALVAWVENGTAPERIVATVWNNDGTVYRTRPLCPFPAEATYVGWGDPNAAASWVCK
ncbi:Tannase/feruloyl esterase [Niveomyces insectorum RCEF 264]|uniref:Carboxylic ester hydrolase n=1 Tax=Niveomyces insectorum RCEF 264 TaxID=1081102 RepID=A0A167VMK7_9HYPO|nr:Tannase/feruloyl esterase [Niveomyces insectorum RCEF 264]